SMRDSFQNALRNTRDESAEEFRITHLPAGLYRFAPFAEIRLSKPDLHLLRKRLKQLFNISRNRILEHSTDGCELVEFDLLPAHWIRKLGPGEMAYARGADTLHA